MIAQLEWQLADSQKVAQCLQVQLDSFIARDKKKEQDNSAELLLQTKQILKQTLQVKLEYESVISKALQTPSIQNEMKKIIKS